MKEKPIKHLKQIEAFYDESRFKFLLVGRRGGKTHLICEDICKSITESPTKADLFYIGPTLQQAYELIWETMDDRFFQLGWAYEPRISKRRFELPGGRSLYILGAEKIRRIRGHKAYKIYLDELAFFGSDLNAVWRAVRPALSDLKGKAIVATTPNGKGTQAYDFFLNVLEKKDWKVFNWLTIDNPYIDPKEIEDAKNELDEKSFKQEYMATWESYEGLAYYNFDENRHIKKCQAIDPEKPLYLCLDFNVNPTTLVLRQSEVFGKNEVFFYKKEYSYKNSSTIDTLRNFCEDYKVLKDKLRLKVRGDSAGKNRSSQTGRSDYFYVEEMLRTYGFSYQLEVLSRNPPIIDRLMHVNSYLKNVAGFSRIIIDPSCKELIRDLSSQVLEGRFPSDKDGRGHKADALGYDVNYDYLLKTRAESKMIQF
jgi:hypothetical protein